MSIPLPREVRQRLMDETARKSFPALRWVAGGFGIVVAMGLIGLEHGRMPDANEQSLAFRMMFEDGAENRTYDAMGTASHLRHYVGEPQTQCRVHDGEPAYDYDCVATVADQKGCTHFYPYLMAKSSIGWLRYGYDEADAVAVLRRFELLQAAPACAPQPRRSGA